MPVTVSYPGVYIEEVTNTAVNVTPASTSDTAFIDWFPRGPIDRAVQVTSLTQFNNLFGGLDARSQASYAIQQFFLNGGSVAWVVRVVPPAPTASPPTSTQPAIAAAVTIDLGGASSPPAGSPTVVAGSPPAAAGSPPAGAVFEIAANNPGQWGNQLAVLVSPGRGPGQFNVMIQQQTGAFSTQVNLDASPPVSRIPIMATVESYFNVTTNPSDPDYIANVINQGSELVTVGPGRGKAQTPNLSKPAALPLQNGNDGSWGNGADGATAFTKALLAQVTPGTALLDKIAPQHFNIMCMPTASLLDNDNQVALLSAAIEYNKINQSFMLVDPPPPTSITQVPGLLSFEGGVFIDSSEALLQRWAPQWVNEHNFAAAAYYPWLLIPDPLNNFNPRPVAPSGTVAGIYAATDVSRGVWKAPAGVNAVLGGILGLADTRLTDVDSGNLNTQGINALRSFPVYGNVVWGARTLAGADLLQSPFKYVDVRRLTDWIEQSLVQSLKWAVFEPNAEPLWASITHEVTAFMAFLFGQGAFGGETAAQAFQVLCNSSTTTAMDIENGIVNVVVAFQPVLPAEFVVLKIQLNSSAPSAP